MQDFDLSISGWVFILRLGQNQFSVLEHHSRLFSLADDAMPCEVPKGLIVVIKAQDAVLTIVTNNIEQVLLAKL
jgi:hypothetical protein